VTATTANLDTRYVDRLKQIEGVEEALPVIRHFFQGTKASVSNRLTVLIGTAYARLNGINMVAGRVRRTERSGHRRDQSAKQQLPRWRSMKPLGTQEYRIAGSIRLNRRAREDVARGDAESARSEGKCTFIFVKLRNPDQLQEVAQRIDRSCRATRFNRRAKCLRVLKRAFRISGVFLRVLVGLAAVVSALVVMLAMYTTITERTREIGILKAMGASRGYIVGIIEKEAILDQRHRTGGGLCLSLVAGYLIHKDLRACV
jgi:hypothetical protein